MRRLAPLLLALTLLVLACAQTPSTRARFTGRVVGVSDGDTLRVLREEAGTRKEVKVRLHGVDAPESNQAFGTRSKQFTSDMVFNKTVTVEVRDTDRYGRTVGWVTIGEKSLNLESVRAGMAWWYRQYAKDEKDLQKAESQAREAKRGLWADANPIAPWEFRRSARTGEAPREEESEAPVAADSTVLQIGRGKKFHRETCKHAEGAKTTKMTRKEAEDKGLTPCNACKP